MEEFLKIVFFLPELLADSFLGLTMAMGLLLQLLLPPSSGESNRCRFTASVSDWPCTTPPGHFGGGATVEIVGAGRRGRSLGVLAPPTGEGGTRGPAVGGGRSSKGVEGNGCSAGV